MGDFAHLHVHTEFSLLDGACRIKELISTVKALGQKSVAITDHGVMYGAVDFFTEAVKQGIKPIIGCEVYVAERTRFDKIKEYDSQNYHLVLLCKNEVGYKNLIKLNSLAFTQGFYSKPRVDLDLLKQYSDGLIALSGCLAGKIPQLLLDNEYEQAKSMALELNSAFGQENFYLEMQDHGISEQEKVNTLLLRLSKETGIPLVATNDAHYVKKEDSKVQNILLCIQTNKTVDEENPISFPTDEFYIKSYDEMAGILPREACDNTVKIAEKCNFEFKFGEIKLPYFDVGDKDHFVFFKEKCFEGLYKKYGTVVDEKIIERLNFELDTIKKMGYIDYFLIVQDYVNYAKSVGIPVGPGRGSGAGSLAAYCIGITEVDPIKYNLLFERFLNPERVSMPDFDVDFCYIRRQEVVDYVIQKYGTDRVAQIVTFGSLAARAAVKDVGRALGHPYAFCDTLSKLIPRSIDMTIESALKQSKELRNLYETDNRAKNIIDIAKKVEGMPRHASKHAAAVVISDRAVSEYVPLAKNDDSVVTQYTMTAIEKLGLLKMDFLGLRNLTIINDTEKSIKKRDPSFSVDNIPENDAETLKMMSKGLTDGVFQFESDGMKNVLQKLKPERIEDLIAVLSLYRPGPMQYIEKYIENRHNPEKIVYKTKLLEPILKESYGCVIYQEQVMQIFRNLANYSLGKADIVRRAMSKKKHDVMLNEKTAFVNNCQQNGLSEKDANSLFEELTAFSSYAFNKSHAAAYAMVAYQTAYLKCHYPKDYMAALLSSVLENSGKLGIYVAECSRLGIKILAPSVNESNFNFTVSEDGIRFGLLAVKNLGNVLIDNLIAERKKGKFKSMYDFCSRLGSKELNKRAIESLIKSGAMDCFGVSRKAMIQSIEQIYGIVQNEKRFSQNGQMGFFEIVENDSGDDFKITDCEEFPLTEILQFEHEFTGMYFSGHPLNNYKKFAAQKNATEISKILRETADSKRVSALGVIGSVRTKTTKNGQTMCFIGLEDSFGSVTVLVFPKIFERFSGELRKGNIILVSGKLSVLEESEVEILCENIERAVEDENIKSNGKIKSGIYIKAKTKDDFNLITPVLEKYKGNVPVVIVTSVDNKRYFVPRNLYASFNKNLENELKTLFGSDNIRIIY